MGDEFTQTSDDKKSFGRDVGKLVSGTVIAQAVAICLTPIITRIFNPEIYGVASVFISIVSIITVIACLRYELAIMLPKDDKDAGAIFLLCIVILICISIICIPVLFIFGDIIANLLGSAAVKDYLFLVPIAVFVDGFYLALRYWNTRRRRFGTQATTQALQSVSANGLKLGFGAMGFVVPGSLIFGQILGHGFGLAILLWQAIRSDLGIIKESLSLKDIMVQARRYKKFPLIDSWSAMLNVASWQVPTLMLSAFFSTGVAGLYSLGYMMLSLPSNLIGSSISQVFFQRSSGAKSDGTLKILFEDTVSLLIVVSMLPFLMLGFVGGDIFSLVFGSDWYEAGVYVQILCLLTMFGFVVSPLTTLYNTLELQFVGLIYNVSNIISRVLSLLIGGYYQNVYLALFLFMLSGVLIYGMLALYLSSKVKSSFREIFSHVKKDLLISLVLFVLFVFTLQFVDSVLLIGIIMVFFVGLYALYLIVNNKLVREFIGFKR